MSRGSNQKKTLASLNAAPKAGVLESHVSYSAISSGPLPTASEFAGYEQTLPGAAERILTMAEKEQDHRHAIELKAVDLHFREQEIESNRINMSVNAGNAKIKVTGLGQALFMLTLLTFIGACCFCIFIKERVFASLFFVAVVGVYLYSSGIIGKDKKQKQEK